MLSERPSPGLVTILNILPNNDNVMTFEVEFAIQ